MTNPPERLHRGKSNYSGLPKPVLKLMMINLKTALEYAPPGSVRSRMKLEEPRPKEIIALEHELENRKAEEGISLGSCIFCGREVFWAEMNDQYPDCKFGNESDPRQYEKNAVRGYLIKFGFSDEEISDGCLLELGRNQLLEVINERLKRDGKSIIEPP